MKNCRLLILLSSVKMICAMEADATTAQKPATNVPNTASPLSMLMAKRPEVQEADKELAKDIRLSKRESISDLNAIDPNKDLPKDLVKEPGDASKVLSEMFHEALNEFARLTEKCIKNHISLPPFGPTVAAPGYQPPEYTEGMESSHRELRQACKEIAKIEPVTRPQDGGPNPWSVLGYKVVLKNSNPPENYYNVDLIKALMNFNANLKLELAQHSVSTK